MYFHYTTKNDSIMQIFNSSSYQFLAPTEAGTININTSTLLILQNNIFKTFVRSFYNKTTNPHTLGTGFNKLCVITSF